MKRGFTLIEMMVALAVGLVGIAAAFAFARTQIRGYANQDEVARMQASAQLVLEGLARDIRNAGYGTSYYAGMPSTGMGGDVFIVDGAANSRGFPAMRIANNVAAPAQVMPGTDAITLLRVTSDSVVLQDAIPCVPGTTQVYLVEPATITRLRSCLTAPGGLVLVSDSSRPTGEPESMLLAADPASLGLGGLRFVNAYGINPSVAARCTDDSNPPTGVGAGSFAVCVEPVSYWVDTFARLRMWQPMSSAQSNAPATAGGRVPIDPTNDAVIAEGVEDLQLSLFMSAESGVAAGPVWIRDNAALDIADEGQMSEARVVRISAVVRTQRSLTQTNMAREGLLDPGGLLEDHLLPTTQLYGCSTPATCYDPAFTRKRLRFNAELRNMRIFDVLSSNTRTWDEMRSFRK